MDWTHEMMLGEVKRENERDRRWVIYGY